LWDERGSAGERERDEEIEKGREREERVCECVSQAPAVSARFVVRKGGEDMGRIVRGRGRMRGGGRVRGER